MKDDLAGEHRFRPRTGPGPQIVLETGIGHFFFRIAQWKNRRCRIGRLDTTTGQVVMVNITQQEFNIIRRTSDLGEACDNLVRWVQSIREGVTEALNQHGV